MPPKKITTKDVELLLTGIKPEQRVERLLALLVIIKSPSRSRAARNLLRAGITVGEIADLMGIGAPDVHELLKRSR